MIIVDLASGFGNQLFQYAAGLALKNATGRELYLNSSRGNVHGNRDYREFFTSSIFKEDITQGNVWNSKLNAFGPWNPTMYLPPRVILRGYFQYLPPLIPIMHILRESVLGQLQTKYAKPEISKGAFIHVRRGDYLNPQYKLPVQTKEYFEQAITYIESKTPITQWIMVSDDIEWCKMQDWSNKNIIILDEEDEVKAFYYMTHWSEAAIISNSTFGWWAAMLGAHNNGSPVVYPKVWHLEKKPKLFPDSWIAL
jgi:hypothetical protein